MVLRRVGETLGAVDRAEGLRYLVSVAPSSPSSPRTRLGRCLFLLKRVSPRDLEITLTSTFGHLHFEG